MKTLIVHQETDPKAGGGHSFQRSLLDAIAMSSVADQFVTCAGDLSRHPKFGEYLDINSIDLIWTLFPHFPGGHRPYVATMWDLSHIEEPLFPELNEGSGGFPRRARDAYCEQIFSTASFVITGTDEGARQIETAYKFPRSRIRKIPFSVPLLNHNNLYSSEAINAYNLEPGRYFLYPAQFWPHKNHNILIEAFCDLLRSGAREKLVLTGTDRGNLQYIKERVHYLGITSDVRFPGFVSNEDLASLMHYAKYLVYPSFFGPDNLPPIEAMQHDCPVIMSDIPGAREQCGSAALYFDPTSKSDLLLKLQSADADRDTLVAYGRSLVQNRTPDYYISSMLKLIGEMRSRRACWGKSYVEI